MMWTLKHAVYALDSKEQADNCRQRVPVMPVFEVAIRTAGRQAPGDVVLYSLLDNSAALAA